MIRRPVEERNDPRAWKIRTGPRPGAGAIRRADAGRGPRPPGLDALGAIDRPWPDDVSGGTFGAGVAVFGSNMPHALRARTLNVQAWISVGFTSFMLFTSNPFERIVPPPADGNDLNPLLQDVGLAMHPPLLYVGYVGFSIDFSFAVAALVEGRVDAAWARWVRPWTLALAVPVLADGIYVLTGKPGVQSQPFARRASTRAEDAGIVDLAEADCGANNFSSRRAWSPPVRSRPIRHPARRRSRRRSARAPHGVQGCGQPRNRQAAGRSAGLRRTASGA